MLIGYAWVSTHEQNLDLQEDALNAAGCEKVYTVFGALAEFERDLIGERTLASLAAARGCGRKGGRPRDLDDKKKRHAVTLHSDPTNSVKDICRTLGISKATLDRYLAERRRR